MIKSKNMMRLPNIASEQGDDCTTGCLLNGQCLKDHYQLIAVDHSKEKEFDAGPRAIQQIVFYGKLGSKSQVCTILENSKETVLEFYKETVSFVRIYKWLNTIR